MASILRSHPISSKLWSSRFSSRVRPKGPREQGMDVQPSSCGGHVHSFPAGQARPGLLASTHEGGADEQALLAEGTKPTFPSSSLNWTGRVRYAIIAPLFLTFNIVLPARTIESWEYTSI